MEITSRRQFLDTLKNAPESTKYTASQQKRMHAIAPNMRFYFGFGVEVDMTMEKINEMLRYLIDVEGWDGD